MVKFTKGEMFPLPPHPGEGVVFSIEQYTMLLIYYLKKPTESEIKSFHEGEVSFAMTELKNTLFILSRFGEMRWTDTPYSTHLSSSTKSFPELLEGQGYAIDAFLVDQESNLLVDHRLLHLDTANSRKLVKIVLADQAKEGITPESVNRSVQEVYANYSTRDLLSLSSFQTKVRKKPAPSQSAAEKG